MKCAVLWGLNQSIAHTNTYIKWQEKGKGEREREIETGRERWKVHFHQMYSKLSNEGKFH